MPERAAMGWKVLGRRPIYTSDWVDLWVEDVEVPEHGRLEHHVLRIPRSSVAVVVTDADRVLMLWRHRFITDSWGWEIPAGWVDEGEPPIEAARREVEEETGWRPGALTEMCSYHPLGGLSDLRLTLYRATEASSIGLPADASESTRIEWIPLREVPRLIQSGALTDGPSLTGLALVAAFPGLAEDS